MFDPGPWVGCFEEVISFISYQPPGDRQGRQAGGERRMQVGVLLKFSSLHLPAPPPAPHTSALALGIHPWLLCSSGPSRFLEIPLLSISKYCWKESYLSNLPTPQLWLADNELLLRRVMVTFIECLLLSTLCAITHLLLTANWQVGTSIMPVL